MDRKELDKETRATKSTRNVWMWVIGIGIVLFVIAFVGGFFNHDGDVMRNNSVDSETPGVVPSDTLRGDYGAGSDTTATDIRTP